MTVNNENYSIYSSDYIYSWQQLEHMVRECAEVHGFNVKFRKVFSGNNRKFEIDVVARRNGVVLAIDCKCYGGKRSRNAAIRGQCATHLARCDVLERQERTRVTPVIVTLLDDGMLFENGCIVVLLDSLDDFLSHVEEYMDLLPVTEQHLKR